MRNGLIIFALFFATGAAAARSAEEVKKHDDAPSKVVAPSVEKDCSPDCGKDRGGIGSTEGTGGVGTNAYTPKSKPSELQITPGKIEH